MGTEERRQAAKEFVRRVREAFPGRLKAAWLFGSVARGDDVASSDVDVFLVLDQRDHVTRHRIYGIAEAVSVAREVDLSLRIMNEAEFRERERTPLIQNVTDEGVALA